MAITVTAEQQRDFKELGYCVVENVIPENQLSALCARLKQLWDKAKKKKIEKIRVYDDYPYLVGGVNVAGIEDPFVYEPDLKVWVEGSGLDRILADLSHWDGADLELARLHMNDRYKYQGFWHRDATVSEADHSIVAVVYFMDEEGFRIVPAADRINAEASVGDALQANHDTATLEGERIIRAKAGSVLLMKSYLLHRGYNNKPRLHLHLRFVEAAKSDPHEWVKYRNTHVQNYDFASSRLTSRLRNLVKYCVPAKSRSSLFQS